MITMTQEELDKAMAYLDEKIKKASATWKGVDVDVYMNEVRGREPDKIYFPADGLPRYIDWDGSPIRTKQVDDSDVCYIRKDTLLEWAKECFRLQDGGSWYSKGAADAFSKVIDKLNSM